MYCYCSFFYKLLQAFHPILATLLQVFFVTDTMTGEGKEKAQFQDLNKQLEHLDQQDSSCSWPNDMFHNSVPGNKLSTLLESIVQLKTPN